MLETTVLLAQTFGTSPFEFWDRDAEDVIMLINHMIERGAEKESSGAKPKQTKGGKRRILVNEKTATGGWY